MKTFIGFFDVLGFKEFINNNCFEEAVELFDTLLREAQLAASGGEWIRVALGRDIPNLNKQKVNCLNISDSIVFWTHTDSEQDFMELVDVCYSFYSRSLRTTFPLRGCLTYGEIDFKHHTFKNYNGVDFYNYSLIGKGLVDAYSKADSLEYAGCVLDESAIKQIADGLINQLIYDNKICMYKVPSKSGETYEHVFRPSIRNYNSVAFRSAIRLIKSQFTYPSKTTLDKLPESVKKKMNNTIDFISTFRIVDSLDR